MHVCRCAMCHVSYDICSENMLLVPCVPVRGPASADFSNSFCSCFLYISFLQLPLMVLQCTWQTTSISSQDQGNLCQPLAVVVWNTLAHCRLYDVHSTLHTVCCTLHTAHCTLYAVHCTLHTVCCTLHIAHCML